MLRELAKCDTKTRSQWMLEKNSTDLLNADAMNPQFVKNTVSVKFKKMNGIKQGMPVLILFSITIPWYR